MVRSWKCPARGWIAVPRWRSTLNVSAPCAARNAAADKPTRLPPTIRTGTSSSESFALDIEPSGHLQLSHGMWSSAAASAVKEPTPLDHVLHYGIVEQP